MHLIVQGITYVVFFYLTHWIVRSWRNSLFLLFFVHIALDKISSFPNRSDIIRGVVLRCRTSDLALARSRRQRLTRGALDCRGRRDATAPPISKPNSFSFYGDKPGLRDYNGRMVEEKTWEWQIDVLFVVWSFHGQFLICFFSFPVVSSCVGLSRTG